MSQERSFDELMAGLRERNDEAAFRVFAAFGGRLVALARSRLDDHLRQKVDADDVVQSVFRSFFVRQANGQFTLAGWGDLWALLVCITVRKCRNVASHFRAARRDVRREAAPAHASDEAATFRELFDREPAPDEVVCLLDTVEHLMRGMAERDRAILSLHLQGHTHAEVGAQVHYSEATVHRVVTRATGDLRRALSDD